MQKKILVVLIGATAVGKTAMAIRLAKHFDTAILSADSRQVFKEMTIGTAKPSQAELAAVPHYFIDSHSIQEEFNAGQFEKNALSVLEKIFSKNNFALLVGGSGLYVKALCEGIDQMPQIDPKIRQNLQEEFEKNGLQPLLDELQATDPLYFEQVDRQNHQRIIRALEICRYSQKPYSDFRIKEKVERNFEILKIGLEMDRQKLYERIDQRMDLMLQNGLWQEAQKLFPLRHLNALQTVGYKEIFDCLENHYDQHEAIRLLKRNSRRYAKRQLTWFGADKEITWFGNEDFEKIIDWIEQKIA